VQAHDPAGLVLLDEPVTSLGVVQPDDVLETVGRLVVAINVHQDGR
jgi:ABC-type molybdate transport system ATPase subunit